jgi:hypothetical protein
VLAARDLGPKHSAGRNSAKKAPASPKAAIRTCPISGRRNLGRTSVEAAVGERGRGGGYELVSGIDSGGRTACARSPPALARDGAGELTDLLGLEFSRRVGIDFAAYCDYFEIGCRPIHFIPPLLDSGARLRNQSFGTV